MELTYLVTLLYPDYDPENDFVPSATELWELIGETLDNHCSDYAAPEAIEVKLVGSPEDNT